MAAKTQFGSNIHTMNDYRTSSSPSNRSEIHDRINQAHETAKKQNAETQKTQQELANIRPRIDNLDTTMQAQLRDQQQLEKQVQRLEKQAETARDVSYTALGIAAGFGAGMAIGLTGPKTVALGAIGAGAGYAVSRLTAKKDDSGSTQTTQTDQTKDEDSSSSSALDYDPGVSIDYSGYADHFSF